jgi:Zn-dependent membrane protease YugP
VHGFGLYLVFFIPPLLLGLAAQWWVKSSFAKWSAVEAGRHTGADVARIILNANGLDSIPISVTPGELSDHYDPRDRSIHLSEAVARSASVSATSVAAHECGHAIQHARANVFFQVRSALARPVGFASGLFMPLLLIGFVANALGLVLAAIALYSVAVLFHIVTLPVELDASRRARRQLADLGFFENPVVAKGSRQVLTAAAMTYIAGALAAIAQLIYFILAFAGNDQ